MDVKSSGFITGKELLEGLKAKNLAVDEADVLNFIRNVLEIKDAKSIADT